METVPTIRLEKVNPRKVADQASRILRTAWQPPCVHYSSEYLSWELGFPGETLAVMAYADDKPVAFIAGVPRRLLLGANMHDVFLVSFHAVVPEWQGLLGTAT